MQFLGDAGPRTNPPLFQLAAGWPAAAVSSYVPGKCSSSGKALSLDMKERYTAIFDDGDGDYHRAHQARKK